MTTTIAYGDTTDGHISSGNANYTTMRTGSTLTPSAAVDYAVWGQSFSGGQYVGYQTFESFTYTVPSGEMVTAAYIRVKDDGIASSTGVSRYMTWVEYNYGASLDTTDWRTPAQISAITTLLANIQNAEDANGYFFMAGSDALVTRLASAGPLRVMGTSDRFRTGTTPTVDESAAFFSAELSGTTSDPALVFTSAPISRLLGVLGAQVQLSDGTHAYLEMEADSALYGDSVAIYHHNGTSASVIDGVEATPLAGDFARGLDGAQALALAVDASDNLYVLGTAATTTNNLAVQAFQKGVGYTWTAKTILNAALPSYTEGSINNIAAAWHNVGTNGTIMAVVSHVAGRTPNTTGDIVYALLNCQSLLAGSGTLLRNSGAARGVVASSLSSNSYYTGYTNETGTLLDVVSAPSTTDRGYVWTTPSVDHPDDSFNTMRVFRYVLNSGGTAFTNTDLFSNTGVNYSKDANAKARVIGIDSTTFATICADDDTNDGIVMMVCQNTGTSSTFNTLGTVYLDGSVASMPSATTLTTSSAWDAVYDSSGNTMWIYYLDVANGNRLMRTSIDMNTYLASGVGVQVSAAIGAAGSTNYAIRVHRGKTNGQKVLVSVANKTSGGTHSTIYILDTLNVAPNAPTLFPRANFDATTAVNLSWTFSDTNAGDTQSAYQLQINNASTGASAVDTGKVTSTTSSRTLTASTLSNGVSYQWRVRTYDAGDLVGAYSSYGTFSTSAGGTVTITSPATDNPAGVITDNYNIVWSVSGTTQASYRVVVTRTSNSTVLVDTGYVTSTATTYNVTGMLTDVQYQISVTVRNSALVVSGAGTRLITPSYGNPEQPTFTAIAGSDHIFISVDNPTPTGDKPEVTENQILRRVNGSGSSYTVVGTTTADGSYKDYAVASGVTYQYIVRGTA